MTNPNAVVSDTQSAIAMALTATVNTSSLYPTNSSTCNITLFSRNKFPITKSIETTVAGAGKTLAWVEAMRASSPTRNSSEDTEHKNLWIVSNYCSSFSRLMEIKKGRKDELFLNIF